MSSIPGIQHKVIGLVSGGKDSTFNLLHCVANGHDLVALATLTPEAGIDELDSHLYQSVGTRVLPLIAESMGLPLFTRDIKGKAIERGPEYGSRTSSGEGSEVLGDETEDLYMLVKKIKDAHPECTALASGAILSNYQRLRIEHVCQRLGLVSISYLWQAAQLPLLERMLECGMEVILVKVAGVGLGIDLVGKNLSEVMPLLRRLESRYGSHPAGEGGEYETLTLSTPLFSKRLELEDTEVIITDPEPYPVAYLRVASGKLVEKEGWVKPGVQELRRMLGLGGDEGVEGLDEAGRELLDDLRQSRSGLYTRVGEEEQLDMSELRLSAHFNEEVRFNKRDKWFVASINGVTRGDESIGEELKRYFDSIQGTLTTHGLSLPLHTSHITLLLPSMSLFLPANVVYSKYFGTSPPSRATVAVPLPSGTRLRLEVVGFDDRPTAGGSGRVQGRQTLHVQGLSYWAPANIGPYSQAVSVNSRVALAGQIPLIPSSLTLPGPDYAHQSILALQHVERIRDVLRSKSSTGGGWTGWVESCTAWYVGEGLSIVKEAWKLWSEREECQDAPVVFVQAEELPKGALVEFQVNFHTGRPGYGGDEDDDEMEGVFSSGSTSRKGLSWETSSSEVKGQGGRAIVYLHDINNLDGEMDELRSICSGAVSVKAYHLNSTVQEISKLISYLNLEEVCLTTIPVHSISSRSTPAGIALEIFS